ncbi:hypothetical protein [Sulfurimonas sp.]|uniref:hypothetical protein n=1 Tax=Sulfurimonas sp. TaxID=2022749 RepID=UPI0025CE5B03|nr:hypothetical protein [Sulfurimonas sp.]
MSNTKVLVLLSSIAYAFVIFYYPASYYNDDSLFLANGILNFSVIDFSPHFPGYPTIVILGKFINFFVDDSKYSLFILSASGGILLPAMLYFYVKELKDERVASFVFLLTISSTYLMNISLSMLSESVGIFFFFLALYSLEIKKYKLSGIILAVAFFARPSYFILYVVGLLYLMLFKKESIKEVLISFLLSSLVFLAFIFATQGMLYIYEAKRFILGHFKTWGTGQNTQLSWFSNIFRLENLAFAFLILVPIKFEKNLTLIYILFISYFVWLLSAQNPDNIRHIIPLVLFANIFLGYIFAKHVVTIVLIFCFNIYIVQSYQAKLSPIDQIVKTITDKETKVLSNRSIEILRESLDNRVFDNYYIHSSKYYKKNSMTYLITTDKPKDDNYKEFYGRFLGEHTFYLIKPLPKSK